MAKTDYKIVSHRWQLISLEEIVDHMLPEWPAGDERARLEREVIEAAKKWNSTSHRDKEGCELRLIELSDAVDALIEFEQKQK